MTKFVTLLLPKVSVHVLGGFVPVQWQLLPMARRECEASLCEKSLYPLREPIPSTQLPRSVSSLGPFASPSVRPSTS